MNREGVKRIIKGKEGRISEERATNETSMKADVNSRPGRSNPDDSVNSMFNTLAGMEY